MSIALLMSCAPKTEYDLVIRNGQIYDGSGQSAVVGAVAINADTIAAVGELKNVSGRTEIDAGDWRLRRVSSTC
jgi:N-acyl-D-amino-acid deacylase